MDDMYLYTIGSSLVLACKRKDCEIVTLDEHNRVSRREPYRQFLRWSMFTPDMVQTAWNDHITASHEENK